MTMTHDCGKGDMCPEFGLRFKAYAMTGDELDAAIKNSAARAGALADAITMTRLALVHGADDEVDLNYAATILTRTLEGVLANRALLGEVYADRKARGV